MAIVIVLTSSRFAQAHEISPSVSDLTIDGDAITFDLRMNIESFVARIDLELLDNTDNTDVANDYDQFRAMMPEQLEQEFRDYWPEMEKRLLISAPEPLTLELQSISIPEVGNAELPRESSIEVTASLPDGAPGVSVTWPADYGALVIRQQGVEKPYTGYLESGGVSELIAVDGGVDKTALQTFVDYIPVGFDHIIPKGLDHILFVLGLFFLASRLRPLVWQISVFTLAHTVTLVLGALGWVSVPASIVEPLIALSIVYVALENIFTQKLHAWRTLLIFGFGLLHGLGFASVLSEFGLPASQFIPALLGFNVGVEVGQLTVVAIAFFSISVWCRHHPAYRQWIAIPASIIIALTGAWWFYERVFL